MLAEERDPRLKRLEFEVRATGVKLEQMSPLRSGIHTRGYLPHVKREGASYFVTFRLADSLPKEVFYKIQRERASRLACLAALQPTPSSTHAPAATTDTPQQIERDYFRKVEEYLDRGIGPCWLRRPEVAGLVSGALKYFDGERYLLRAWVVMPTHVHAVLWPMPNYSLSTIVKSWKGFTAHEINKLIGRSGRSFWQPEAYDRWIRNEVEHDRCCRYVIHNPVKARLCRLASDWQWSSAWPTP